MSWTIGWAAAATATAAILVLSLDIHGKDDATAPGVVATRTLTAAQAAGALVVPSDPNAAAK